MENRNHMGAKRDGAMIPVAPTLAAMDATYPEFIKSLKDAVRGARAHAALHANRELTMLYWDIGNRILQMQEREGWGAKVIDRISHDLSDAFPDMRGFSATNIKYMRRFAQAWPRESIGQHLVDQLPWSSNIVLLTKLDSMEERAWYARQALENGWGRDALRLQIERKLIERSGGAVTNFGETLPSPASRAAEGVFKDPHYFDFIGADIPVRELALERKLTEHIQEFLLELGRGFAFVGRQVPLEIGDTTYRLDMLFYHLKLRCFVVIELKAREFEPAFIGQLNMYRNAVDDLLKRDDDQPTIGLLLVKGKNDLVVKYALGGFEGPLGVANWQSELHAELPKELSDDLPTVEEIEKEIELGGEV